MNLRLPETEARRNAPLTADQQAESARIICALIRRQMTLPEALRALPGQRSFGERAA
jgi:hypothetical protein